MAAFDTAVLTAQTTSASSAARPGPAKFCRAYAFGTFAGATVTLQTRPLTTDNSAPWFDQVDLVFTANGSTDVFLAKDEEFRGTVSGATGSTSVSLRLVPLHGAVNA
jgi:hypothetical protein